MFTRTRLILLLISAVLLVVCLVVAWETRDAITHLPFRSGQEASKSYTDAGAEIVDLSPWQTAQALATLAVTAEEKEYARDAERLADHSVDQAFAAALREASLEAQQRVLSGTALALSQKVTQLQQFVAQDQVTVNRLTDAAKSAKPGSESADVSDDSELGIAQAQLQLDSDELSDLTQVLARAEGDKGAEIKAELAAHEASMKSYDSQAQEPAEIAIVSVARNSNLAGRLSAWFRQNSRLNLIEQAQEQALEEANEITPTRNSLQAQIDAPAASATASSAADRLARIHARTARGQLLSIYDDRIQTEQHLSAVYEKWAAQVKVQHRILLHLIMNSCEWVLVILLGMVLGDVLVQRVMEYPVLDARSQHTLRAVLELTINVAGMGCILLVIFGAPRQMGTILGLSTAALTIVLQDFFLAFLGWFVLIGKRGMRVGDSVEIDGTGGEVTEVGLMSTTLLETGSQSERGYPTGRRITLMNGFAIRGKYFNFSTTGQWTWDQFEVAIPDRLETNETLEGILKAVEGETADDVRKAEQELSRGARAGRLSRLGATPTVHLLPSAEGRIVEVRYVTRALERLETRARLYRRVLEVLHEPAAAAADTPTSERI